MKKIFNTFDKLGRTAAILGVGVLTLTACNDWLDTTSDSLLKEDALYQNSADIQLAVNGIYADLCSDPYIQLQNIHQGAGTDIELIDGIGATTISQNSERDGMNYNASTSWAKIGTLWEDQYKTIEDCNRIIAGIKNSAIASENDVMISSAEARVIRAMVYLDMIRVFGDIPFMWSPAQSDLSNVNIGKTDRDVILDSLIVDLGNVVRENKLPWCGTGNYTSERVTMGFAEGLLANIYMTRAGFALREDENSHAVAGGYSSASHMRAKSTASTTTKINDPYKGYTTESQFGTTATYPHNGSTPANGGFYTLRPSNEDCAIYYSKARDLLMDIINKGKHGMNLSFAKLWDNVNKLQLDKENIFEIPMGYGIAGELGYSIGVRMNGVTTDYGYSNSAGKVKTTAEQLYSYSPCDTRRDITCVAFELKNYDRSATVIGNMTDTLHYIDATGTEQYVEVPVQTEMGTAVTIESLVKNKPFGLYIGKWDVRKMSDKWKEQNRTASAKFGYGINTIKMRYPQILLWEAECEAQLKSLQDKGVSMIATGVSLTRAVGYIKDVHSRAYNDAVESYKGDNPTTEYNTWAATADAAGTAQDVMALINTENKLEFCGECFRKWDLIRWNTLHDAIVEAKKVYCEKQSDKVFQEKVYFKYLDYKRILGTDGITPVAYLAPEKSIDWNSVTWYGGSGDNTTANEAPSATFFNDHGYRYAKPSGYTYPGFGADNKDLNAQSYVMNSFGQDYTTLDTDLPSICSGLVGSCNSRGECDDSKLTNNPRNIKNRYIMPIYNNVVSSSYNSDGTARVYNSYGY